MKLLKSRKGQSVVEVIILAIIIAFLLYFIPAVYSVISTKSQMTDVLTASMQKVATEGGLTDDAEEFIYKNLEVKGLLPDGASVAERSKIIIFSDSDARSNHTENLKYKDGTDRKILISIYYPAGGDIALLNGLCRLIGAANDKTPFQDTAANYYYKERIYVESEKSSY